MSAGVRLAVPGLVVALLAVLAPAGAGAQPAPFKVTYEVDRSVAERVQVRGTVLNEARFDAIDVYVTAEALDAGGKVVARGVTFVTSSLARGRSEGFVAKVPAVKNAVSFRVAVSSYRQGLGGGESP